MTRKEIDGSVAERRRLEPPPAHHSHPRTMGVHRFHWSWQRTWERALVTSNEVPWFSSHGRTWDVLVVGGASGVGKSTTAYRLAHELGVGICEVDDLHQAVLTMTTPDQQPVLHRWHTSPEAMAMSPTDIVDLHIAVCRTLIPAVRDVIAQHVEDGRPIVLEGDYLVPELLDARHGWAAKDLERVRAVFLHEPDTSQVARNLLDREPEQGDQTGRASVTQLFGTWLRDECSGRAAVSLEVRPYATVSERLLAAIR